MQIGIRSRLATGFAVGGVGNLEMTPVVVGRPPGPPPRP